jgi:hypothetical protein
MHKRSLELVYTLPVLLDVLAIEYVSRTASIWQADNADILLTMIFIKLQRYY